MTIASYLLNVRRLLWAVFAVLLFVFGFAIGGTSEVGHHAGLILGGICVGWGLKS